MAIAAVPNYLGKDFRDASPGLRFGMFLDVWASDFAIDKLGKTSAWKRAASLTPSDRELTSAILARQSAAATQLADLGELLRLEAISVSPFSTGLGNEHPLENGFAFLNPYGLPYLAGSGIKGVLRQAARELASGDWGETHGWSKEKQLHLPKDQSISLSIIDVLFGLEGNDGDTDHVRGVLTFWDVIPQMPGDTLHVEIMTPHQSHYLQNGDSPHESGQPIPINFLSVPPGAGFAFNIQCNLPRLACLAPTLAKEGAWRDLVRAALEHAFDWLGFGAKSAVGYGAMREDPAVRERRDAQRAEAEAARGREAEARKRQAELAQMSPARRAIEECLDEREDKNQPELPFLVKMLGEGRWDKELKLQIAQELKSMLQAAGKWRETLKKKDKDSQRTRIVMDVLGDA